MTHRFAKYLILAIGALGVSALPAFAAQACANQAVVTGFSCSLGNLTFSFESVGITNTGSLFLLTPFSGVYNNGTDTVLEFQYSGALPADFNLTYEVSTNDGSSTISAVDSSFPTPANGGGDITENVCGQDPAVNAGSCQPNLVSVDNNTGVLTFSKSFGPVSQMWVVKDVTDPSPGFSNFTDSVVTTPEPASEAAVLGLGLVALLAWKRRASNAA